MRHLCIHDEPRRLDVRLRELWEYSSELSNAPDGEDSRQLSVLTIPARYYIVFFIICFRSFCSCTPLAPMLLVLAWTMSKNIPIAYVRYVLLKQRVSRSLAYVLYSCFSDASVPELPRICYKAPVFG